MATIQAERNRAIEIRNLVETRNERWRLGVIGRSILSACAVAGLVVLPAEAGDGTWDGGGSQPVGQAIWGGNNNWNPNGAIANGTGYTATFGTAFVNGYRITVNTARTIGHIVFNDPADASDLTLSEHVNLYTLTLDVVTGTPTINVTQTNRTLTIESRLGGSDGLAKIGPGTLMLGNANIYAGATVVSNGTLRLGADNSLNAGNNVVLAVGALDMGGYTNQVGTLELTGAATLVLGSGSLSFADSSAVAWSGTLTLTGQLVQRTVRFGTSASALTGAQLKKITYEEGALGLDADGYLVGGWRGTVLIVR